MGKQRYKYRLIDGTHAHHLTDGKPKRGAKPVIYEVGHSEPMPLLASEVKALGDRVIPWVDQPDEAILADPVEEGSSDDSGDSDIDTSEWDYLGEESWNSVVKLVGEQDDTDTLLAIGAAENKGKARASVLDAIEARLQELSEESDEGDAEQE